MVAVCFFIVLGLALLLYLPGLKGAFLLDDYLNLAPLGEISSAPSWKELLAYALGDISGALPRVVSLLTFAIEHQAWPGDPWQFKYVNLMLHLLNGCLLFWFFLRISSSVALPREQAELASLFAASAWLLHPMQVSTTLYVVQRMTEMSALFTLVGLLAYVRGRRMVSEKPAAGYAWLSLGIGLGGLLATFSKETGVLLPLYALVLEQTLLCSFAKPRLWKAWAGAFLYVPLALVIGYFIFHFQDLVLGGYGHRDFTLGERLLTEPRVLTRYLGTFFFPLPQSLGLFHDDYVVSRSLIDPPQTLAALVFVLTLLALAFYARSRAPVFAFGVLWFFGGQVLESTVIPLEIYFEHRNYLPMAGVLYGVSVYGAKLWHASRSPGFRRAFSTLALVWLALLCAITGSEAKLWGDPVAQAAAWSSERPGSLRAQERMGDVWAMTGHYGKAAQTFASLATGKFHYAAGYISWLQAGCYDEQVPLPPISEAAASLHSAPYSVASVNALRQLVRVKERKECPRLGYGSLEQLLDALLHNPAYRGVQPRLYNLLARLQIAEGLPAPAIESLKLSFAGAPSSSTALLLSQMLAAAGHYREALAYVQEAGRIDAAGIIPLRLHQREIEKQEQAVKSYLDRSDLRHTNGNPGQRSG